MRNAWYPVFLSEELGTGRIQSTKLFGDPVVLFRGSDGQPACFLDSCPHRSIPFSLGRVVEGRLQCAYHGWQYGGDGRCAHIPLLPKDKPIPRSAVARTYPSVERHGLVWVWPGDPRQADVSLLPLPYPACEGYQHTHIIPTIFESRYDLVIDHGLDQPHFFQLHARTLGLVLRDVRVKSLLQAGTPTLDGIEEDDSTFSVKWRVQRPGGEALVATKVFHPCYVFAAIPVTLSGNATLQQVFFFTPLDERRTRGFLCAYRNFLTQPVVGRVVSQLYEWVMAHARAEDDAIFAGQLSNAALGAKSSTSWSYDVVATRYQKWQGRRSTDDMWFKDLDHARRRYLREDAV